MWRRFTGLRARLGEVRWQQARATWTHLNVPIQQVLLTLVAAYYVGLFEYIAMERVGYPFDLEWMEGAMLDHVSRVVEGLPLYVEPSLDFTPFIYTPLYYWVCAPFVWLFGNHLAVLRGISIAASAGMGWFLYAIVLTQTRSRVAGWVAVGVLASGYAVTGAWLDLARVDSLYLCLVLAGLWLLARPEPRDVLAGLCFAAAFMAKQTAVMIVAPIFLARLCSGRGWSRISAGLTFGAVAGLSVLVMDLRNDSWFSYYVFDLPRGHPLDNAMRLGFWRDDISRLFPFVAAAAFYRLTRPDSLDRRLLRVCAGLGCLGAAWFSRMHVGGWDNVLLPALVFLAWMGGEALRADVPASPSASHISQVAGSQWSSFATSLLLVQFALFGFDPERHLPTEADRTAGYALVQRLAEFDGEVLLPFHGNLARMAGKPMGAHDMALVDVLRAQASPPSIKLDALIREAFESQRYAAVVLNRSWRSGELAKSYVEQPPEPVPIPGVFFPRTGWITRPSMVLVPRPEPGKPKRKPRPKRKAVVAPPKP